MDHHSFAFQLFLFLMFYGTFEWIRHEQSKCTSVTQGQQEQTSDLTHTVGVVNETIDQTDGSIVTSSTSTDIQVRLETEPETEPAFHTPELGYIVVHQVEEPAAVAVELEATELNAIAPIEPVSAESSVPTLSTTESAIPPFALESSPNTLFPTSVSITAEPPLSAQSEPPIHTLLAFPLDVISEASSIEAMTAAAVAEAVEIVPNLQPTGSLPKTPSHKKRQPRQTKKIKALA